ncbi:uncharacterized protein CTHT_0008240 [Thermochaetoides thermophila DSM 1495]|uniref:CFEM domain-containing protein n=1 Tax=Chaetomium thermophilum (strain DSM 1495 / CBS 144.50 / IMI 039719) TaxID=759272 RepID=G0S002_CHATD|nr:hypothetical protein CTHT_0008240 [Thermochaetoides thermophila DSM 1495]EGS23163.1 hypothetical protein CTHT_0008240 [Thermochaetoides thermophila DSM 1495]
MKNVVPLLALAAGAQATFPIFAPPFSCPANTDNKCLPNQFKGFDFADLNIGEFFNYNDFNFRGWKCEDEIEQRGRFAVRTGRKVIGGVCSSDKKNSPSFGCGPNIDKFSLGHIVVKPEFDIDLEFHYDMPDGSVCKQRAPCKKSGTKVVNKQCGGAKNVTIIVPPQKDKPKPTCSIKVPTISFDCNTPTSTLPPKTRTTATPPPVTTTTTQSSVIVPPAETTATPEESSTSTGDVPAITPPAEETTSASPADETSSTTSADETSSSSSDVPATTSAEETTTSTESPETPATSAVVTTETITTSYQTTSTIFTTETKTITQCEPTVTSCPAGTPSVTTTVVTIAISTTVCPVTETLTTVVSSNIPVATSEASSSVSPTFTTSSVKPVETVPVPELVPSCLNTFLYLVSCADNTDAECYCPNAEFVKNVYECFYAHGKTDEIISEAVTFFQGICGKWAPENPAIATDATVTSYITVTATPTVVPVYTTIVVDITTVVPCTDEAGSTIPSSSTTVTVSTSLTVPQVDFTTAPAGNVDLVPITSDAPVVPEPTTTTTFGIPTSSATGTGALFPTTTAPVFVGAGERVGASFGMAAAVAAMAVFAL